MQAVARSRSPLGLRDRSRSPSPRRQWNDDIPLGFPPQGTGIRNRMMGVLPWKIENQSSTDPSMRLPQVGGLYSAQMQQRSGARDELLPTGTSLLKSDTGALGESWEKMMTFRTFVIDRVGEEAESEDAVVAYKQYKENFRRSYIARLFRQLKDLPVLAERYNPQFVLKQFEECKLRCRLAASEFMKLLIEERFNSIALVAPILRPVAATSKPFRLLVGPFVSQHLTFLPLSDPYYIPEDPDECCLCLRSVPAHISKWDILEHLTSIGASDGLVDLTVTVPEGTQLTAHSPTDLVRTVWVKYDSDDACAAAELKLEGTNFRRYTCRPVRRVRDLASYVFRVAPSEACHPARVSRDLRLSARLIVKLDDIFGVSGLLGVLVSDTEKEILTEARCQQHPVLAELPNVLQGVASRTAFEQLDLQLLYLRVVHCTCYYSGRRFSSPREAWDTVGPLYVRPKVLQEEVLSLPGFSSTGDVQNWDSDYGTAADIFKRLQQDQRDSSEPYDDHEYRLPNESIGNSFEPSEEVPVSIPKDEEEGTPMAYTPLVKVEEDTGDAVSMMEGERKPVVIKTENEEAFSRGRLNPWLTVLDTRITALLGESFEIPVIDEEREDVARLWNDFCKKNMSEVEAEKWRCSLCKKLFRGSDFVYKHLKNKHGSCLTPIIEQVKFNYMIAAHQNDHYRIPILPPKPTPFLYRTAYLKQQRRKDSPAVRSAVPPPLNLPGPPVFSSFLPGVGGARLGSLNPAYQNPREYKDLDAPKPVATANGNLRAAINYDDL